VPSALLLILGGDIPDLVAVTPASAAAAKCVYAMTDLGSYGGGDFSSAARINNHQIAGAPGTDSGYSRAARGQEHAFLLRPS
jgi:hypothetical protein